MLRGRADCQRRCAAAVPSAIPADTTTTSRLLSWHPQPRFQAVHSDRPCDGQTAGRGAHRRLVRGPAPETIEAARYALQIQRRRLTTLSVAGSCSCTTGVASHLCAASYCLRYRPAARQSESVDTSTSHIGFGCVIQSSIFGRMSVKLHRCSTRWRVGPCWRMQKALDEQGIAHEVVSGPSPR
jgi:hypothetical protein